MGALGGLMYLRLLNRSVDSLAASSLGAAGGQARFAIPVLLVLLYNRCAMLTCQVLGVECLLTLHFTNLCVQSEAHTAAYGCTVCTPFCEVTMWYARLPKALARLSKCSQDAPRWVCSCALHLSNGSAILRSPALGLGRW